MNKTASGKPGAVHIRRARTFIIMGATSPNDSLVIGIRLRDRRKYTRIQGFIVPNIWSEKRLPNSLSSASRPVAWSEEPDPQNWRSRFQQDYDRLLFSTPVRRLSDKTQVWPMDENDGVRTRLTHSHEVANLARSIGSRIASKQPDIFGRADLYNTVQPILLAIGLAHDLGNPPFGHQGEIAIAQWFEKRNDWIFSKVEKDGKDLSAAIPLDLRKEFTSFDGNPQSLRLIAKLQTHVAYAGLDLTAATLAASLKYPVAAANCRADKPSIKKMGYFASEADIVEWIRKETGLSEGQRHPLTWIMEACDDIAYSVLDVDDVMKKEIISPDDVFAILDNDRDLKSDVINRIRRSFESVHAQARRAEVARDIKIGYLRAHLIEVLIGEASRNFLDNADKIMAFKHETPLMEHSLLCNALKKVANQYAFANSSVLRMEAIGAAAIDGLMSFFWTAISDRAKLDDLASRRRSAKAKYGYSLISPNYIENAIKNCTLTGSEGGVRYRELRLLTDMVSGMTDTFAIKLWREVGEVPECQ